MDRYEERGYGRRRSDWERREYPSESWERNYGRYGTRRYSDPYEQGYSDYGTEGMRRRHPEGRMYRGYSAYGSEGMRRSYRDYDYPEYRGRRSRGWRSENDERSYNRYTGRPEYPQEYDRRRDHVRSLSDRTLNYDVNDYVEGGAYDRGFVDRSWSGPRTWISDRQSERRPRTEFREYERYGYGEPFPYAEEGRYGRSGEGLRWGDRRGRAWHLPNANVW